MDYDVPGPSILDIVLDGGGGCFPQPAEPELPFGLPPLEDGWFDEGWGEDDILGPGLPFDLFGEDNGATYGSATESLGGGLFDSLGGIGDAIGGGIGGMFDGIGGALGGGIFGGGVGGIGGALGGGLFGGGLAGIGGAISGGAGDILRKVGDIAGGGGVADYDGGGCFPQPARSPFEDMIVY
jgi:hypothetical protein